MHAEARRASPAGEDLRSVPATGSAVAPRVPTDGELVARFRSGDRAAFELLVRRWETPLLHIAYRVTGDLAEAEEIRQTVFLRILESPGPLRRPDRFASWIRRCTLNASISALRRRKRRQRLLATDGDDGSRAADEADHPAEAADERRRLAVALEQLDPTDRALLALRFDEGLGFAEIAAVVGRSVSTVKTRVHRSIGRLRRTLGASRNDRSA